MEDVFSDAGLVIVGGGSGSRFGGDKLMAELAGVPLFCVTLRRLAPLFAPASRVMAVPEARIAEFEAAAARANPEIA